MSLSHPLPHGATPPEAGSDLRRRFEQLGTSLGDGFGSVVAELQRRAGPKAVADSLGITTVTASRLLKALSQTDPLATLQLMPGPKPLRQIVESARETGVSAEACSSAMQAVEAFDELIRLEAGDRGSLKAMISAWLPQDRREFVAQRRQAIFKSMAELEGVSAELELNCIMLHPGSTLDTIDIIDIKALLGIDRIRPDAVVQLGTQRLGPPGDDADGGGSEDSPRLPTNLEGEPKPVGPRE